MMMNFTGAWFLMGWLLWLAVTVYLLVLATRFVSAVERIADRMGP
jgi:hypothetical protein